MNEIPYSLDLTKTISNVYMCNNKETPDVIAACMRRVWDAMTGLPERRN